MRKFNMFITVVCFLFLIKLRWPKNRNIYDTQNYVLFKLSWVYLKNILKISPATVSLDILIKHNLVKKDCMFSSCSTDFDHVYTRHQTNYSACLSLLAVKIKYLFLLGNALLKKENCLFCKQVVTINPYDKLKD